MKKSEDIAAEIIKSIVTPLIGKMKQKYGIEISAEEIISDISEDIQELELYHFIEHVKRNVMGMKLGFRCNAGRKAAWDLIGMFIEVFEGIGGYSKKYDAMVEASIKDTKKFSAKTMSQEEVLSRADALIAEIEKDYEKRKEKVIKKRKKKTAGS